MIDQILVDFKWTDTDPTLRIKGFMCFFFFFFLSWEFIEFWWQIKLLRHPSLELFIREDVRRELGGIKINVKEQRSIKK